MMLIESLLKKDKAAAAKLITQIENGEADAETLKRLHELSGKAQIIGITGPPGTGKSTLICALAKEFRSKGKTVGILAVDPTSPFSGGAILGDRIRMNELTLDTGVFIRSMATRDLSGGLSKAIFDAIRVLDAYGMDYILIETVGAGQDEVDVYRIAHTNVVVESPGLGDDIQTLKAGILETADIFVVNKAEKDGADILFVNLNAVADARNELGKKGWKPRVVKTSAIEEKGLGELARAIADHRAHLKESGELEGRERSRVEFELWVLMNSEVRKRMMDGMGAMYSRLVNDVAARKLDPHGAKKKIIDSLFGKKKRT